MKTIFRMMCIAGAVVAAAACANNQTQTAAVDVTPTVAVEQVTRHDVPQEVVYPTKNVYDVSKPLKEVSEDNFSKWFEEIASHK